MVCYDFVSRYQHRHDKHLVPVVPGCMHNHSQLSKDIRTFVLSSIQCHNSSTAGPGDKRIQRKARLQVANKLRCKVCWMTQDLASSSEGVHGSYMLHGDQPLEVCATPRLLVDSQQVQWQAPNRSMGFIFICYQDAPSRTQPNKVSMQHPPVSAKCPAAACVLAPTTRACASSHRAAARLAEPAITVPQKSDTRPRDTQKHRPPSNPGRLHAYPRTPYPPLRQHLRLNDMPTPIVRMTTTAAITDPHSKVFTH
jgi:hypothetical protein